MLRLLQHPGFQVASESAVCHQMVAMMKLCDKTSIAGDQLPVEPDSWANACGRQGGAGRDNCSTPTHGRGHASEPARLFLAIFGRVRLSRNGRRLQMRAGSLRRAEPSHVLSQVRDGVLPGHCLEPHGVGQLSDLGTSCSGLSVGNSVRPPTQQDLLDDGHHLH